MPSLQTAFYIGEVISAMAAIFSVLRGEKSIHESHEAEFDASKGLVGEKVISEEEGK